MIERFMPTQNVYMEINKKARDEPLARSAPNDCHYADTNCFWPSQTVLHWRARVASPLEGVDLAAPRPVDYRLHDPVISGAWRSLLPGNTAAQGPDAAGLVPTLD
jgi:hypothetical protein